jgi:hypothetical protein
MASEKRMNFDDGVSSEFVKNATKKFILEAFELVIKSKAFMIMSIDPEGSVSLKVAALNEYEKFKLMTEVELNCKEYFNSISVEELERIRVKATNETLKTFIKEQEKKNG